MNQPIKKSDIIEDNTLNDLIKEVKSVLDELVEIDDPHIEDCEVDGKPIDKRFTKVWVLRNEL